MDQLNNYTNERTIYTGPLDEADIVTRSDVSSFQEEQAVQEMDEFGGHSNLTYSQEARNTLNHLEEQASKYLQRRSFLQATEAFLACLDFRNSMSDSGSKECLDYCHSVIQLLNEQAMQLLKETGNDSLEVVKRILKICEEATLPGKFGNLIKSQVLIMNNLACVYRREGRLQRALSYLERAYKLVTANFSNDAASRGMTCLNLSALLSQMGK